MQRTTITLDDDLAAELEAYLARNGGQSRSEAIRDLIRRGLGQSALPPGGAGCYGIVSYVVDQSVRNLAARLPQGRLDRHDQTVAALSVPLDHSHAVEISVMRGAARDVSAYAEALFLERGVMHGALGLIPVAEDTVWHVHNDGSSHAHSHPRVLAGFRGTE
ncbi:nickel-responsive transcriptional regulator NikR [Paenirhodobacter populi]|uniref:nickel-responsive transcriptional regulator NikR n=1 Tax=Paenirhodobacter populi TaxID=2306993 RepID=UPI000FE3166E|nr:nickel-responsive transcriptional regulator NikR [Sinirhodobacter populi]RWR08784.1 nickel-responsive transcriptional regulator NikR [Sinirhodobacter populi]